MESPPWRLRLEQFEKAFSLLQQSLEIDEPTQIDKGAIVKFYEMSFELAWKAMKDYVAAEGIEANSPRESIKHAFGQQIIDNGELWLKALKDRNLTAHVYKEAIADKVIGDIRSQYLEMLLQFLRTLTSRAQT